MGNSVLSFSDLHFSYPKTKALSGLNAELERGVFGLLGPNGAGKSTLFKVIIGFLRPQQGKLRLFEDELSKERKQLRRFIGYMPEVDSLIPDIDAVTMVSYLAELSGISRKEAMLRAHEVLFYVGLQEERYRKVNEFSTGMRQKLKLAQALAHNPKLLLLDEPTNGMDPAGRLEMLNLIRDLARVSDATIIIATHILQDVEYCCEKVLILDQGRLLATEDIGKESGRVKNGFRLKLKGAPDAFLNSLAAMKVTVNKVEKDYYKLFAGEGFSSLSLFELARASGVQIRHFQPLRSSLEEIFLQKIGRKHDN